MPGLVLFCGINPGLYTAAIGHHFGRPGNRFWPAALAAGLVTHDRDPRRVLHDDGVGMTDLVKRATVGAGELRPAEYRAGAERVERIVRWLEPHVVCFVGLAGYCAVIDGAEPGKQAESFGGAATYVSEHEWTNTGYLPSLPTTCAPSCTRASSYAAISAVRFSSVATRSRYDCANDSTPRARAQQTSSASTPAALISDYRRRRGPPSPCPLEIRAGVGIDRWAPACSPCPVRSTFT
jgi:TDG/mug DNA glycosylase family protein